MYCLYCPSHTHTLYRLRCTAPSCTAPPLPCTAQEYFQGIGGCVGVLLAVTGSRLPGQEAAVAEGNSLGKGPLLFHIPQVRPIGGFGFGIGVCLLRVLGCYCGGGAAGAGAAGVGAGEWGG